MASRTDKVFSVRIDGDYTLSVDDVWPDGDAPKNPTTEDVIAVMKSDQVCTIDLITLWDLNTYQGEPRLIVDGVEVEW